MSTQARNVLAKVAANSTTTIPTTKSISSPLTSKQLLKLDGQSDELPSQIRDYFEWIVLEKQVGARWRPSQHNQDQGVASFCHLGSPTRVNSVDCCLFLSIGQSPTTDELLVLLIHTVNSRRMFMVLPAESLTIGLSDASSKPLTLDQVPEALFERPSDPRSSHSNGFLHVSFSIASGRSQVIMPWRQYDGKLGRTAQGLLNSFKSLSESLGFDLYLKFNTYAQVGLLALAENLVSKAKPTVTPAFDLTDMYSGNRPGAFDEWDRQGWCDKQDAQPRKRRMCDSEAEQPPMYRPPPPPYSDTPGQSVAPQAEAVVVVRTPPNRADPIVTVPRSCTPAEPATTSIDSTITDGDRVCETPCAERAVSTDDILVNDPILAPADLTTTTPAKSVDTLAGVPVAAPATALTTAAVVSASAGGGVLVATADHRERLLKRCFDEMVAWLTSAWRLCPTAHYVFIVRLLCLVDAATRNNVALYRTRRLNCTRALLAYQAKQKAAAHSDPFTIVSPETLLLETARLITWMSLIDPSADTLVLEPLVEMEVHRRAIKTLLQEGSSDEYTLRDGYDQDKMSQLIISLYNAKASIVARICLEYGAIAMKSQDALVGLMRKELDAYTVS